MDDIEEIKKLKARYFRALDSQDWDLYESVFAEDIVVDLTRAGGEKFENRAAFMVYARAMPMVQSVHHGHMPEIDLTGPDSATGVWVLEDYNIWQDGTPEPRLGPLSRNLCEARRTLADQDHGAVLSAHRTADRKTGDGRRPRGQGALARRSGRRRDEIGSRSLFIDSPASTPPPRASSPSSGRPSPPRLAPDRTGSPAARRRRGRACG